MAYQAWAVEWDMPVLTEDPFRRNVSSGWGGDWTTSGGVATAYSVDGARGIITILTGDTTIHSALLPDMYTDFDVRTKVRLSAVATDATIVADILLRAQDTTNNLYRASLGFTTTGTVDISLVRLIGGSGTGLGFLAGVASYTADSDVFVWIQGRGPLMRVKVWTGTANAVPGLWTLTATEDSIYPSGQVGVRARLVAGNTNTDPRVMFDDFRAWVPERWIDVTSYVDTGTGPFEIASGDTPEASADTGGFGLPLVNSDQRFTPGNVISPYYPNIAPGGRIRVRETIGDKVFDRGFGYIQYPEITAWTESNSDSPRDQTITIPVVDRAAWLGQGRTFISTLAEHIIYHGGSSIVGYWPMGETDAPDVNPAVGSTWTLTETARYNGFANAPTAGPGAITYGIGGIAPADDLSSILFSPSLSTDPIVDYVTSLMLVGKRPTSFTLAVGQVLTVVCWTRPGDIRSDAFQSSLVISLGSSTSTSTSVSVGVFEGEIFAGAGNGADWAGTVTGPVVPQDQAIPVAVRVGVSPDVLELWVRDEIYTGTLTVSSATAATFDQVEIGERYPGAVNHAQIYLGAEDDWGHDDFLAQRDIGLSGLERQSTGERIRTILAYAGVDASELGRIDDGASLMQVARMAGRGPLDLVAETVATEQGEFFVAGNNQPVFADRIRLLNV